jgi:gliding motility-associated-like protein
VAGATYSWTGPNFFTSTSQNPSISNATSAATGTYSVTATVNGCVSAAGTASVTVNPLPIVASTPSSATVCSGSSTNLTAAGASTYTWAPATGLNVTTGATVTAQPTVTTTYTITGTSAAGCVSTANVTVTVTAAPVMSLSPASATICAGNSTSITASGVTSYTWSPATGLNATTGATVTAAPTTTTTYTVTGSASGCPNTTANITVSVNALPTVAASSAAPAICSGQSTTITGSGASTYTWSPATGLSATTGTSVTANPTVTTSYTVTGTALNGCTNTATVNLTINALPNATATSGNVTCNGANNGTATVNASGGSGTYTYAWTPSGGTGATASNLAPGSYTVTVNDGNTCQTTASVTITQPSALASSVTTQSDVSCNGGTNGSATVNVTGGAGGYTYSWSPTGGTNATATGLAAGTYTLTATDANLCPQQQTVTIAQPAPLTASIITPVNVSCFGGSNGSATVNAAGGTINYSYAWLPSGGTAATASNLTAGSYTVTVTDGNLCTQSASITITEPTALSATTSSTNATCGNPDGTATVSPTGGTPNYTYSWSSGQTTATATGLIAGSYTVTVMDNNLCPQTTTVTVTNASAPTATLSSSSNVSCFGGSNGSATINVTGGAPGYDYSWSPSGGTAATATGLTAGNYTVTVTDTNNCITSVPLTITEPAALASSITTQTNVSCNGGSNGTATVNITGGTPNYSITWSPSGGTSTTATGLAVGTYTVNISDGNNCPSSQTVTITQPTALTVATSSTATGCTGSTGTATATPSGGSGTNYTYLWSDAAAQTTATATGLAAGPYTVTVTDSLGCIQTTTVNVTGAAPFTVALSTNTNASCFGAADGSASFNVSGAGPYNYSWSPAGGTTPTASNLAAGSYTITVTDPVNNCVQSSTVTITQPAAIIATATSANISCNGGNNGSATVNANGGTGGLTYSWSPAGGTNATASGLTAGSYTVTVTDANGCDTTASVTLTQPAVLTASSSIIDATCSVNTGSATVLPSGGTGPYSYTWNPSGPTTATATNLAGGNYTVTVTDANGCSTTSTATISNITGITAGFTTSTTSGPVPLVVDFTNTTSGAVGYLWSFGDSSIAIVPDPSHTYTSGGTYTVTMIVTNADGCMDTLSIVIEAIAESALTAPNVFTPNGDGTNDFFLPESKNITEFHGEIYDRWGILMYDWDEASGSWDGHTTSGNMASPGVYYFIINAKGADNKEYMLKGFLTLLK